MKIENVETFFISLPLVASEDGLDSAYWSNMEYVLIRIDTDAGISGWGDGFGYHIGRGTKAVIDHKLAPSLIGRDARDIAGISNFLQRANHTWGRYGITLYAISGIDIALWDIAGKAAGLPIHRLLGGKCHETLPGYASLFKYQDPEAVAARTAAALAEGYRYIKLHETAVPETRAAREAAGPDVPIMLDTNCPWSAREAEHMAEQLQEFDLYWLEEPIWPPEDFEALADLRMGCGIPIAAGENACTAFEFQKMFEAGAVTYAQPSVTKVGGITEFRKVEALAEVYNVALMPHSPYFGPGFLATLHLAAARPQQSLVERFFATLEASLFGSLCDPVNGAYAIPEGPGLGCDPDPDVMRDYLVKDA